MSQYPPPNWQQPPQSPQPNTGYPSNPQWPPQQPPSQPLPPQYTQYPQQPPPPGYQPYYPQQQSFGPPPGPPPPIPPKKKVSLRTWIILGILVFVVISGISNAVKGVSGTTPTTSATPTQAVQNQSVATTAPQPTAVQPTAKPTASFAHFGDGTYQVGKDIQPGTYRTRASSSGCYYERVKGFSGSLNDIIANNSTDYPAIVTILATDKGFDTRNCDTWTKDLSQITTSKTTFNDGMYFIGTDITPGTYRNSGGDSCYLARLSGFGNGLDDIISNNDVKGSTIITIAASDKGFESHGCGTWNKL